MISVMPATVTEAVATVGAALWTAGDALSAGVAPAEAAVTLPTVAAMARPMPAMIIFGCRMMISLSFWFEIQLLTRLVGGEVQPAIGCPPGTTLGSGARPVTAARART